MINVLIIDSTDFNVFSKKKKLTKNFLLNKIKHLVTLILNCRSLIGHWDICQIVECYVDAWDICQKKYIYIDVDVSN